ncbi:hemolysin III [Phenylobacterium sp. Root77]|jgi:hemolysin III|uniref:PAQR family membrane homeostasis protein TrhA n=1 Tax=unclassified Phenylobacterium TaxID=2640670 RepID=UPI0006F51286|nr:MULTISPECIES: hemolysin III family protein [unclassified Phenylobacterium]KQW68107.1 hemolysin III [Phenylobacterium sp. Root1277]KQW91850.1 hemolysin III [Phenylobacterium sp. Root1290]KRC40081.1 hemolysin III [Phenylobacterium sp. Root77]
MSSPAIPPRHYPTPSAKCADLVVHVVGLTLALIGGIVLLTLAVKAHSLSMALAVGIYAAGLLAMLGFSTAYNFAKPRYRPTLRRLDHAGIFLMIAGSYTPFTTQTLTGAWSWGMTAAVWSVAAFGALGKVLLPGIGRRVWVAAYLLLGWIVLVAFKPLIANATSLTILLLAIGGLLYSSGVAFYLNKQLRYARAIWHGHVVAGAGVHWAAVLLGVVLTAR